MKAIPILCALGLLAGCSSANQKSSVAALESGLTAADILALQYADKPLCTGSNGPVCADPAIKAEIKKAAGIAYTAVKTAEASAAAGNAVDVTAVAVSVAAYQQIVTTAVTAQKGA